MTKEEIKKAKKIISKLKSQVAEAKKRKDDLDENSWGYQTGVLLTPNEAIFLINYYKSTQPPTKTVNN